MCKQYKNYQVQESVQIHMLLLPVQYVKLRLLKLLALHVWIFPQLESFMTPETQEGSRVNRQVRPNKERTKQRTR